MTASLDPHLDLEITRYLTAKPAQIWRCLTEEPLFLQWFAPLPARAIGAVIEAHVGGRFHVDIRLEDGRLEGFSACILAITLAHDLTFTTALGPGFRPTHNAFATYHLALVAIASGTRVVLRASHPDRATCAAHAEAGFHDSWTLAFDQLAQVTEALA
ncbi:MAG: SRPBCC domain-containing protein [Maritimibacter sp.]